MAIWAINRGITDSTYDISSRTLNLRDTAGYDDTVILHEMDHYEVYGFSAGDDSSLIDWTAPRSDAFYLRVTHAADWGIYGSYKVQISPL